MRNILFLTDFSQTSDNAFVYALNIAKNSDAALSVMHVYNHSLDVKPVRLRQIINQKSNFEVFGEFQDQVKHLLKLASISNCQDCKFTMQIKKGNLMRETCKIIATDNIDFVIIGTDTESDLFKKFSKASVFNIIKSIKVPVLAIPLAARFKQAENVGFTTIFRLTDFKTLRRVIRFSEYFDADTKCLHITNKVNNDALTDTIQFWKKSLNSDRLEFIVKAKGDNSKERVVLDFVKEYKIDYLCMLRQNFSFFRRLLNPSLSSKLMKNLDIPICIIKDDVT